MSKGPHDSSGFAFTALCNCLSGPLFKDSTLLQTAWLWYLSENLVRTSTTLYDHYTVHTCKTSPVCTMLPSSVACSVVNGPLSTTAVIATSLGGYSEQEISSATFSVQALSTHSHNLIVSPSFSCGWLGPHGWVLDNEWKWMCSIFTFEAPIPSDVVLSTLFMLCEQGGLGTHRCKMSLVIGKNWS